MEIKPFTIPKPLAGMASRLPVYPPTLVFVQAVNLALGQLLRADTVDGLRGKRMRIRVKDAGISMDFILRSHGLEACRETGLPDLTISANTYDFLMLALRREDPDTLFFSRRLLMEGDTELGLLVKNSLDALELPPLDWHAFAPGRVLSELRQRVLGQVHSLRSSKKPAFISSVVRAR